MIPLALACAPLGPDPEGFAWPDHRPPPVVPPGAPSSAEAVALGARLFSDGRLSADGGTSCATRHVPEAAWVDGLPTPTGADGSLLRRNAPTLWNVAWRAPLGWADPTLPDLEAQALVPLLAVAPPEHDLLPVLDRRLAELAVDPELAPRFARVFPGEPVDLWAVVRSLAAFERSLVSADTPWDSFLAGEPLPEPAAAGHVRFRDLGCDGCHAGPDLTRATATVDVPEPDGAFAAGVWTGDEGLGELTRDPADRGAFRIPSLRAVVDTGPWLHDGSAATLDQALERHGEALGVSLDGPDLELLLGFLATLSPPPP